MSFKISQNTVIWSNKYSLKKLVFPYQLSTTFLAEYPGEHTY